MRKRNIRERERERKKKLTALSYGLCEEPEAIGWGEVLHAISVGIGRQRLAAKQRGKNTKNEEERSEPLWLRMYINRDDVIPFYCIPRKQGAPMPERCCACFCVVFQ